MMRDKKIAIVTGASRGIGESIAKALSLDGYIVCMICRQNIEKAKSIAESINGYAYQCDISEKSDVKQTVFEIIKTFGKIDILVNNAGVSLNSLFHQAKSDDIDRIYNVNLFGTLNMSRAVLPTMINQKSGCIINISSIWGQVGASCEVDYSTSKAAIIGFTKALSKEVGLSGIRVNCIAPGVIETDMMKDFSQEDKQILCDETPLNRLGTPNDVAKAVSFLASEKASFITGEILSVGGGFGK